MYDLYLKMHINIFIYDNLTQPGRGFTLSNIEIHEFETTEAFPGRGPIQSA